MIKILVVDDEPDIYQLIKRFAERADSISMGISFSLWISLQAVNPSISGIMTSIIMISK